MFCYLFLFNLIVCLIAITILRRILGQRIWLGSKGSFRARIHVIVHLFAWRHRGKVNSVALHANQAQIKDRGIAPPVFDPGARRKWVVIATLRPLYPRGRIPVPIIEAWWSSGPFWTGLEGVAPNWVRTPERPARSESLIWRPYPGR
jgi:hypothetical protein